MPVLPKAELLAAATCRAALPHAEFEAKLDLGPLARVDARIRMISALLRKYHDIRADDFDKRVVTIALLRSEMESYLSADPQTPKRDTMAMLAAIPVEQHDLPANLAQAASVLANRFIISCK